jgi:hypothetical protein
MVHFWLSPSLLKANVLFRRCFLFESQPGFGPNSGFWCCVFLLTLWISLLRSHKYKRIIKDLHLKKFLVYSQIWLNLSTDDCQYYRWSPPWLQTKDTSQSTAPGMTTPVLWNKLECAKDTRRLSIWLYTHPPGEGELFFFF